MITNLLQKIPNAISSKKITIGIVGLIILLWLLLTFLIYRFLPLGVDWRDTFRPATLKLLSGHSPYELYSYSNSPWILIPIIPFAILPEKIGYAAWTAISLLCYIVVALKFKAKILSLIFVIFSYPVLFDLFYGQIDALIILGYILPPPIGIFFALSKPQIGLGIAIFWIVEFWQKERFLGLVKLLAPVSLTYAVSIIIFGAWFMNAPRNISMIVNASLWPLGLPLGLALLVYSIRRKKSGLSISASPFLSPYVGPHSWAVALLGLLPNQLETIIASIGLWIAVILSGWWL